jgi:hypothetical protein
MTSDEKETLMTMAQRIHDSKPVPFHWETSGFTLKNGPKQSHGPLRIILDKNPVAIFPTYEALSVSGSKEHPAARLENDLQINIGNILVFHRPEEYTDKNPEPFWLARCLEPGPYLKRADHPGSLRAQKHGAETFREYLKEKALVDIEWFEYKAPTRGSTTQVNILEAKYELIKDAHVQTETQFASSVMLWFPSLNQDGTIPKNIREWIRRDCNLSNDDFTLGSIRVRAKRRRLEQ